MLPPHPLAWVHPILAAATTALVFLAASLGFRARRRAGDVEARARHAWLAPRMYVLVLINWGIGFATVWWLRPDDLGTSGHFVVGSAIVAILSAGAALSIQVPTNPRARTIHPLLGAVALVLFGVQLFLGLQLLP